MTERPDPGGKWGAKDGAHDLAHRRHNIVDPASL